MAVHIFLSSEYSAHNKMQFIKVLDCSYKIPCKSHVIILLKNCILDIMSETILVFACHLFAQHCIVHCSENGHPTLEPSQIEHLVLPTYFHKVSGILTKPQLGLVLF
jgi:hypothetical protein